MRNIQNTLSIHPGFLHISNKCRRKREQAGEEMIYKNNRRKISQNKDRQFLKLKEPHILVQFSNQEKFLRDFFGGRGWEINPISNENWTSYAFLDSRRQ